MRKRRKLWEKGKTQAHARVRKKLENASTLSEVICDKPWTHTHTVGNTQWVSPMPTINCERSE